MKKKVSLAIIALGALSILGGSLFALSGSAEAHERRNVQSYTMVVGWLNEPAFVNQNNSIDLRVSKTADSSPVTGLNTTLKAQVTAAGKNIEVPLTARFNTPGAYNGYLMPTKTGEYTFTFTGTIEGAQINEKFTSGPGTFGSIEEPKAFPDPLVSGAAATEGNKALEERVVKLESASGSDGGSDSSGTLLGIVGIVVGAIGIGVGGLALSKSKA
jgi:hypothetical protein